jgi:SAM-dependent methyltransferase
MRWIGIAIARGPRHVTTQRRFVRGRWAMTTAAAAPCEWVGYVVDDFSFTDFPPGARVLDVGFGTGFQMRELIRRGCVGIGIETDRQLVVGGRTSGWPVCRAVAEQLPFRTAVFDGLICKVVVPYTREEIAVNEIARVLRRGAIAHVSYHGAGYYLRYLLTERNWKRRVYGARVLVNTWFYALTRRRLRGFCGDTLYQSERRLRRYYEQAGLEVVRARPSGRFLGAPVFIYHSLRR